MTCARRCNSSKDRDFAGHSYKSVQTIINHYLARDRVRADARLIDKLEV